ncbi:hypothetical protein [Photobacterium halotolerans]|uniref:Uncharacterized protein n=1 Tax=Photobacterium halotolerans TaxID=265726 RepID=A0A7X4WDI2_9GAMM|nr:hypothetical protein [Photobacterium halotolerans]NAW66716.1 hypothetical protein [Photobacterium halotolerans]
MKLINQSFNEWVIGDKTGYFAVPDDFAPLLRKPSQGYQWLWIDFEALQYIEAPKYLYNKKTKERIRVFAPEQISHPDVTEEEPTFEPGEVWSEIERAWMINKQAQFEWEVSQINETRRQLYAKVVDPLMNEARMLRLNNDADGIAQAEKNELQAQEWYKQIKIDHPWPEHPQLETQTT